MSTLRTLDLLLVFGFFIAQISFWYIQKDFSPFIILIVEQQRRHFGYSLRLALILEMKEKDPTFW